MKESDIKDFLAGDLSIISRELMLIQTEYRLRNDTGTDGYIDILAKDIFDNYVIIEVKKSMQSSRQAIHEIMKYVALLKRDMHLSDSEIRVMIVSTEWDELYTPFCEWREKVDWMIEGFIFKSDKSCDKITEKTSPVMIRQLSRNQLLFLYNSYEKLRRCKDKLSKVIQESGLQDYFLLELKNIGNERVIYPFALNLVIQRCTKDEYISILIDRGWDEQDFYDCEYEGEELLVGLEESIYKYVVDSCLFEEADTCNPEILDSMIAQQGWVMTDVHKFGYFNREKRDNEWFLRKAIEDGNNFIYSNLCDTKFKLKFKEMLDKAEEFLYGKDEMYGMFLELRKSIQIDELLRVTINISNRGDIILGLIRQEIKKEIEELPFAEVFLEYQDGSVELRKLMLVYNGNEIRPYCYVLDSLLHGSGVEYMYALWSGEIVMFNDEIMKNFGLTYDWKVFSYADGKWIIKKDLERGKFSRFYIKYNREIDKMKKWFEESVVQ